MNRRETVRARRVLVIAASAAVSAAAAAAFARHVGGGAAGRRVPGGVLVGDAALYDTATRVVLGSFFRRIAADVAASAAAGARVLEVGCGPGHLSIRLAGRHGLEVTGLDLDPAIIERAEANARWSEGRPSAVVPRGGRGVASIPRAVVRRRRQHLVDASLGRPDERAGRDRSRSTPPGSSTGLGPPARSRALPSGSP
jgi:SAM-dependent methyltransferase